MDRLLDWVIGSFVTAARTLAEAWPQIAVAFVALFAAVWAQLEKLKSNKKVKLLRWKIPQRRGAQVLIAGAAVLFLIQSRSVVTTYQKLAGLRHVVSQNVDLVVTEASGAASAGARAYVVGDEWPIVYTFHGAPPALSNQASFVRPANAATDSTIDVAPLSKQDVDDLEAAAMTPDGDLLVTTSFSDTKNGEDRPGRSRVIGLRPAGGERAWSVTTFCDSLRPSLLGALTATGHFQPYSNEDRIREIVNIEGLAVAGQQVYFGLRSPLSRRDERSFVLQTPLAELRQCIPRWRVHELELRSAAGASYGIVSMEYDRQSGTILILGNAPDRGERWQPMIWRWSPTEDLFQRPTLCGAIAGDFTSAKPEALVLPDTGPEFFVYLDAESSQRNSLLRVKRDLLAGCLGT